MESNTYLNIDRVINILQNGTKFQKKEVFKEIKGFLENNPAEDIKRIFEKLLNIISLSFQDSVEMCRENALDICIHVIGTIEPNVDYLLTLVPAIHQRLCSDTMLEPSEELRLKYIELISLLIEKHKDLIVPYYSEMVDILVQTILDSAPQVKKKSCYCVIQLSEIGSYDFHPLSKKLIPPLAEAIHHQHWRVRVSVLEAIEILILKGDPKNLPDGIRALANRLFDDSPHVRLALTRLIGNWMLNHYDRYSYFCQTLPLMLTCLIDNEEHIRNEARNLWEKAGAQYLLENENDYKDRIDWELEELPHYPPGIKRPGLGCRILVDRQACKFVEAIGRELRDWVVSVRIKSAQLLSQVILHAERQITQELHKIIGPMSKAAMDEEAPSVIEYIKIAAEYLGYFVPPETYCKVILEFLREANYGELRIVAGIIRGSPAKELVPHLKTLTHLDITTFKGEEQSAKLDLIQSIFKTCGSECLDEIGESIWGSLVSVAGLAENETIANNAVALLSEMCELGGGNRRIVFNRFCKPLLASLLDFHWSVHCHQQYIFKAVIFYTGEVVEENIDSIIDVFKKCLVQEETDPEVILKVILTLNKIISDENITLPTMEVREYFKNTIITDILYEQLKWKPGRSAEAIRTMTATSLFLLLPRNLPPNLIPVLLQLIDDANEKTRTLSIASIKKCSLVEGIHEPKTFSKIMEGLLKRLDDCNQKVREMSLECISELYRAEFDLLKEKDDHNSSLLSFTYETLLIHLDDSDKQFRIVVLDTLKMLAPFNYQLLLKKIRVDMFRDKDIAQQLVYFIEEKLAPSISLDNKCS
ncbi:dynein axonemal assembly factor 5 [Halyomorpha halys]|uniref:dynein axonemal assembly factor 5 n=1 Tax=Halyomorpha halys TaxID=286706 RepID=UPI0006D5212E